MPENLEYRKSKYAPIIVFAYNRLGHIKRTLEYLENAYLANETDLFIFADGAREEEDRGDVFAVQKYLNDYAQNNKFNSLKLSISPQNQGLAKSVINGVTQIMEKYGRAIVVEDDICVSKDFINYMNQALVYYQYDKRVWSICGWTPSICRNDKTQYDTYVWYRGSSWGWATWIDRWKEVDWEVRDYSQFRFSYMKRRRLNRGGADLAIMLDMQQAGVVESWAIRWLYSGSKRDTFNVFPNESKIINIGHDGTGTNCHQSDIGKREDILLEENINRKYYFSDIRVNKQWNRRLYRYYSGSRYHCFKWWLKSVLNRIGIYKYRR